MRMYDLIVKKKKGEVLSKEEIDWMIKGYVDGSIPDYQMSAMTMAICFQGMNEIETRDLTLAMAYSGEMLDLSDIDGIKVDKHSTGGVGDKTSLVLGPMVAALDIPVAKMSGRGLGHTGGTIDKLESICGFITSLSEEQFKNQVNDIKIAIAGQTKDLAPADKKLYALRDVTATVDKMCLIASSIMSKKLASGADAIVLDVKTGDGAFMKSYEDARELAEEMVTIGTLAGRNVSAVISDMDQPLGFAVGNILEVIEAIETLKGNGPKDLTELVLTLGSLMVVASQKCDNVDSAREMLKEVIANGKALDKFYELVEAQGGDVELVKNTDLLPKAKYIEDVVSVCSGYIAKIETEEVGKISLLLGGGRETKDSVIDMTVGIVLNKKTGEYVSQGEKLAVIHANDETKLLEAKKRYLKSVHFTDKEIPTGNIIKTIISDNV